MENCTNLWKLLYNYNLIWNLQYHTKAPFGWDENRRDEKGREENREENVVFPYLIQERKQEGKKTMQKKNTLDPQIFILSIWEEN